MRTSTKFARNLFTMNTSKNIELKVLWNEHFRKKGVGGPPQSARKRFQGQSFRLQPSIFDVQLLSTHHSLPNTHFVPLGFMEQASRSAGRVAALGLECAAERKFAHAGR